MGRLDGETAIVTGSTSGLGKEIARMFCAEGARVVVTGRDEARGRAVTDTLVEAGAEAELVVADVGTPDGCQTLIDRTLERFGQLSVLVNNAVDIAGDGAVGDVTPEAWERILRVNLAAVGLLSGMAIPHMVRAGRGSIVNVSSRTAERATPRHAAYTAAKGGMDALARSITLDYARQGIRCNTVQPGYIVHEQRDASNTPQRWAEIEAMCLTRPARATDVAYACLYLASREAEVVSGVTLNVDSGSTAGRARTFDG